MEEADRLLVIGGNLFSHHGRILPGDIDNADKDIGVIAVHKECLRKEFQLFQDEIQNVRTRLITSVIVEQMKIVDIRHQKGVLFFFASVIEKRKNFSLESKSWPREQTPATPDNGAVFPGRRFY